MSVLGGSDWRVDTIKTSTAYFWNSIKNGAYKLTSSFGKRNTGIDGATTDHKGNDFAVPEGTYLPANYSGIVKTAEYNKYRGNYIVVEDELGNTHYYQHLSDISVEVGDVINIGDILGKTGNTGVGSGAHLHYEVHNASGEAVDSMQYITGEYIFENDSQKVIAKDMGYTTMLIGDTLKDKTFIIVGNILKWLIIIGIVVVCVIAVYNTIK